MAGGLERIHFTPATLLNGLVRVGETETVLVVGVPSSRRSSTLRPSGAEVRLARWGGEGDRGATRSHDPVEVPSGGPGYAEIDKETYEKLGGISSAACRPGAAARFISPGGLRGRRGGFRPPGQRRLSGADPTLVHHRGSAAEFRLDKLVVRISAEAPPVPLPPSSWCTDLTGCHFMFTTDRAAGVADIPQVSQPTRHFRPDRLPAEGSGLGWFAEVRGLTGFVRLFVDGPTDRIALIDPPAASLQLHG